MTEKPRGETPIWSRIVEIVSVVGPPTTVLAALLIYFGWARSYEQAQAMGLDVNLFGYTTQDFVLLSIIVLYKPLLCLLLVVLLWVWIDRAVRRRVESAAALSAPIRRVLAVVLPSVTILINLLMLTIFLPLVGKAYLPYFLAFGVLLIAWAIRVYGWTHPRRQQKSTRSPSRTVEFVLVSAVVTLLLFWGTTNIAEIRGKEQAVKLQNSVSGMPRTLLYSTRPLNIGVKAVTQVDLGTTESPLYRYDGLRLLTVSGGRYFFLHDGWTVKDSRVVVLPDDSSIRIEYGH
ncbi:hypothetical protein [Kocuria rosea]|uniref:hypothetical protein n=1 Tax=Kocuria rosea TaxID=1275 RepID=UPI000D64D96D|nr:hypothetical protein [Kocuria rosea]PWF80059.1 hypothetical protein DEJ37_17045 [Kocuria rosea]STX03976.1 Uncharacterised protein [Kocuria rosea]